MRKVYFVWLLDIQESRAHSMARPELRSGPFSTREEAERTLSGALKTGQFARGEITSKEVDDEEDETE